MYSHLAIILWLTRTWTILLIRTWLLLLVGKWIVWVIWTLIIALLNFSCLLIYFCKQLNDRVYYFLRNSYFQAMIIKMLLVSSTYCVQDKQQMLNFLFAYSNILIPISNKSFQSFFSFISPFNILLVVMNYEIPRVMNNLNFEFFR